MRREARLRDGLCERGAWDSVFPLKSVCGKYLSSEKYLFIDAARGSSKAQTKDAFCRNFGAHRSLSVVVPFAGRGAVEHDGAVADFAVAPQHDA